MPKFPRIHWIGCLAIAGAMVISHAEPAAETGPIVITRGGTYRGSWTSDDANVPVIKIATREPVIIEHSQLHGRGTLIDASGGGANVTIRNTIGVGLNPNIADRSAGRFFTADEIASIVIEQCELDGTAGIYIHRHADGVALKLRITGNIARNIDGRKSDGHDGYRMFNRRTRVNDGRVEEGFDIVQFVQLDGVTALEDAEIAWNHVINEPGRSRVEDNISIYESSGTETSPLLIHDNCIDGAYTIDPARASGTADGWREDWDYSGGGIMLGDGPAKTLATAAGHARAERNVIIATSNYGIAIAAGHDLNIAGNTVLASGLLLGGQRIAAQNVGIYVWDTAQGKSRTPPTFFANGGSDNIVGWAGKEPRSRNDWWMPDAAAWEHDRHWPDDVTLENEQRAIAFWTARAAAEGKQIGPSGQ